MFWIIAISVIGRSIYGTFTTIEVVKALEKGYRILEIKEVWHFKETTDSLFTDYVNLFLRLISRKVRAGLHAG